MEGTLVSKQWSAAVAETHISTVLFCADRAYKLLKPVRTSFLDHRTVEARLSAINQELVLNRRVSPDVYLGTADVEEAGVIVDRMLVMRRLPEARRLTTMIGTHEFDGHVRDVARAVAVFHAALPPESDAEAIAGCDAVRKNWYDNFADLSPLVGSVLAGEDVDVVRHLVENFLDNHEHLFADRIRNGHVRDGHGDLRAEDIFCLDDGPRILDCLAFDRNLRVGDVLLDVAFLVMDLDRLAGPSQARRFIRWYCEFTNEHHPATLAHHYVAYRAHVRAKVAAIRYRAGEPHQAEMVRHYHAVCLRHLLLTRLSLTIIGGTPGTGKSTLAEGLSNASGFMLLGSDELRKDLTGTAHLDRGAGQLGEGIYDSSVSEQTYTELLRRAKELLLRGESVVLDASWYRQGDRDAAGRLATEMGARFVEVQCGVDAHVAQNRIAERLRRDDDSSDAQPEMVKALQDRFEPWPAAMYVDTAVPASLVLDRVLDQMATVAANT